MLAIITILIRIVQGKKEYLTHAGTQRLNGYQALAFSRIRYTDSAFHREARHREVAESVYKEFAQKGVETYKKMCRNYFK